MHFDKKAQIRNSRRVKHTITAQGQHVQTTLGACLTVPYSFSISDTGHDFPSPHGIHVVQRAALIWRSTQRWP